MVANDKSNPNSCKVRKAKVGGYRDYFEDKQKQALNQLVLDRLGVSLAMSLRRIPATRPPAPDLSGGCHCNTSDI